MTTGLSPEVIERYRRNQAIKKRLLVKQRIVSLLEQNDVTTTRAIFSSQRVDGFLVIQVMGLPILWKDLQNDEITSIRIPLEEEIIPKITQFNETTEYLKEIRSKINWTREAMTVGDYLARVRLVLREAQFSVKQKGKWTAVNSDNLEKDIYMEFGDIYNFSRHQRNVVPFRRSSAELVPVGHITRNMTREEYVQYVRRGFNYTSQNPRTQTHTIDPRIYNPVVGVEEESPRVPESMWDNTMMDWGADQVISTVTTGAANWPIGTRLNINGRLATVANRDMSTYIIHNDSQTQWWAPNPHQSMDEAIISAQAERDRQRIQEYTESMRQVIDTSRVEARLQDGLEALTSRPRARESTGRRDRPFYRRDRY
jgi:hypothetical protein